MTKSSLSPSQRQTVDIIEALRFGVIEHLSIRNGLPCYQPAPRIVQAIKLDSAMEQRSDESRAEVDLKREFEILFGQLSRLQNGFVNIEIRHSVPFRLIIERTVEVLF